MSHSSELLLISSSLIMFPDDCNCVYTLAVAMANFIIFVLIRILSNLQCSLYRPPSSDYECIPHNNPLAATTCVPQQW